MDYDSRNFPSIPQFDHSVSVSVVKNKTTEVKGHRHAQLSKSFVKPPSEPLEAKPKRHVHNPLDDLGELTRVVPRPVC